MIICFSPQKAPAYRAEKWPFLATMMVVLSQHLQFPSFGDFSFFGVILIAWSKMAAWRNPLFLYNPGYSHRKRARPDQILQWWDVVNSLTNPHEYAHDRDWIFWNSFNELKQVLGCNHFTGWKDGVRVNDCQPQLSGRARIQYALVNSEYGVGRSGAAAHNKTAAASASSSFSAAPYPRNLCIQRRPIDIRTHNKVPGDMISTWSLCRREVGRSRCQTGQNDVKNVACHLYGFIVGVGR